MLSKRRFHSITVAGAAGGLLLSSLSACYASPSAPRDNSGRQIAVVVPGMPHPEGFPHVSSSAAHALVQPGGQGSTNKQQHDSFKATVISAISTPAQVSPEVKAAVERGAIIAQGLSKLAIKRLSDFSAFMASLWRHMNEMPLMTPGNSMATTAEPVIPPMQPIADPGKSTQMYFTNERRVRTVVGR